MDPVTQNGILCEISAIRVDLMEADKKLINEEITEEEHQEILARISARVDNLEKLVG